MKMHKMTRTHWLLIRFRPALRFIKTRILHIDDSPERIARGIAAGLFTAWLPLFGLHIILAFIFAAILRANKAMALLFVWVSNPLTAVVIYYPCYRLGRWVMVLFRHQPAMNPEQIKDIFTETLSMGRVFADFFTLALWKQVWTVFLQIGVELFIGGLLLGFVVAKTGYWLSVTIIKRLRARRQRKLAMKGKTR